MENKMKRSKDGVFDNIIKEVGTLRSYAHENSINTDPARSGASDLHSVEASAYKNALDVVKKCFNEE